MANIFLFTTIVIVVSSSVNCERRAYLHYSNNFQKALPPHWKHDQEELNRNLVKNQGQPWEEVKLGSHLPSLRPFPLIPRLPPLRPARRPSWPDKSSQNHLYDKEQTQNRVRQLKNKLTPQIYPAHIQTLNQPDRKPDVKVKPQETATRQKREAVINHGIPQGVRPGLNFFIYNPSIYYPGIIDSLSNNTGHHQEEVTEKRDKRQIMLLIKQKNPMELRKMSRTTPNPFIRETNIADYDIVKAGKEKSDTDVVSTFDTDSYLLSETSELDYESDYTITMSDSEDWDNYPLTTPSGPNPGWGLSTLADIYQRRKGNRAPLTRVKRSPKMKRKIGEHKRKLKQRRKNREAKRKRRIIRSSKEDKEVKEEIKDEEIVEKLLKKPRRTTYPEEKLSKEILWSNNTHRIVEDPDAKFEWINKTHYKIYKVNATEDWYKLDHVLVYGEEYWKNRTSEDNTKQNQQNMKGKDYDEDYSEDYDEEFTKEEEEERAVKVKKSKKKMLKEVKSQKKIIKQNDVKDLNEDTSKIHTDKESSENHEDIEITTKSKRKVKKGKSIKSKFKKSDKTDFKTIEKSSQIASTESSEDADSVKRNKKGKKIQQTMDSKKETTDISTKAEKKGKKRKIDQQEASKKKKVRKSSSENIEEEKRSNEHELETEERKNKIDKTKQSDKKSKKDKLTKKKKKDLDKSESSGDSTTYNNDESVTKNKESTKRDKIESDPDIKKKKKPKDKETKERKRIKTNSKKSKKKT